MHTGSDWSSTATKVMPAARMVSPPDTSMVVRRPAASKNAPAMIRPNPLHTDKTPTKVVASAADAPTERERSLAKLMTECHDLEKIKKEQPQLYKYMLHELSMMYTISYVFLAASKQKENYQKIKDMWKYLKETDPKTYRAVKTKTINFFTFPGPIGRFIVLTGYKISKKILKYN